MARRSSRKKKRAPKCMIVQSAGGRRKVCWGANGKIKSNKKA